MRADIDPTTIPRQILPGISLIDVVPDDRRYVYRLVGTGDVAEWSPAGRLCWTRFHSRPQTAAT
jgi:hypothetical protein